MRLLPNRALSRLDKKTFSLPRSSRCPPCPRGEHFIVSLFIVLLPSSCIPGFLMTLILPHRTSMILLPCVNSVDLTPITSSPKPPSGLRIQQLPLVYHTYST